MQTHASLFIRAVAAAYDVVPPSGNPTYMQPFGGALVDHFKIPDGRDRPFAPLLYDGFVNLPQSLAL